MAIFRFSNAGGFGTYQRYNDFLAGNPAVIQDKGSMYPLGVFTLAANQTTISFTNIPQTFKHLQLRGIVRSTNAAFWGGLYATFNSDSTSSYSNHHLVGNGSSASSSANANETGISIPFASVGTSATAGIFGSFVMDVLDYNNTNKFKTTRTLNGRDLNGGGSEDRIGLSSGAWRSSSAITSIALTFATTDFVTGTSFALYGVNA